MASKAVNDKPKIAFKKVKNKNFRKKKDEDDDSSNEEDSLLAKLEESKELRKYRRRQGGISAEGLLVGEKTTKKEGVDDDPFKTKTGGMLDLNQVKNAKKTDDAYDTGIGTSFSAETNRRDEDAEMQKYIEENLAKRKGIQSEENPEEQQRYQTLEEAALHAVPDILRESTSKRSEEMLSNQMLSGIPEVDLGLEAKIRNIEATEEAKQKLLRESMMKKERPSEFVPKNMAVNFVQHNRCPPSQIRHHSDL
ncbi:splicing factor C9orf78 homolog isoform X2 [Cherax quadricarinatus]|uniref:splicing factor C9orf78 homolog isoform X2 n=1 Tax=Cherax quadricarinatus TaxID=27406 RepID=UPI002379282C|nr:splicing factor C9orf78 homolog isoform X2 [Cherax quadricarinatus]